MAEIGLAAAQTLIAAMDFCGVKEKCAIWGYKSELVDLEKTVNTIKNVLKDFEGKELNEEGKGYIEDLKDAVYDADDLFDEFVTRLELRELQGSQSKGSEFFQKVRRFFSSDDNQVSRAYRMYHKVKKIQRKLNSIADDHNKFVLNIDDKPISMRREETCSYVDFGNIIGRDGEKNDIIDELLRSKNEDFRFLTVVGMGGMGKTALAKLVYNDKDVRLEFGNSMYWVCVSDQDRQQFDVKAILCKILEVAMPQKSFESSSLEVIQKEFQVNLRGKKYLLVLDDVWNENRKKWVVLEELLKLGRKGSRVLVTTRSKITATIIGDGQNYSILLQGLSPENSRRLFEMTAFSQGHHQQKEFIELGNKIVGKCYNNPLAIKVVGSLLYGQDIGTWKSFEKSALAKINKGDNEIMSVLKFSYHNLEYPLKCCFTYCAVFPKDYVLKRRELIRLWMAQGYIVPSDGGQSIEDAAEEHFSILLRRCFFQDVKRDEYNDVVSVKIHDLMHDVAQEVGGGEIQVLSSVASNVGNRTRHVSVSDVNCIKSSSNWTNLRSVIGLNGNPLFSLKETQVGNWRSVRVLNLRYADVDNSLNSIGKLHHLRYLNLSGYPFEELPSSITKLHNLETLILYRCRKLIRLPHGFSKLAKLSELDVDKCEELICMPLGMDKLTRLRLLPYFVVGKKKIAEKHCDDELKVLGTLINLTDCIKIHIGENYRNVEVNEEMSGGYLSRIPCLKDVRIDIRVESVEAEAVMEKLQPHSNVKWFRLFGYKGRTIPRWGRADDNWEIYQLVTIYIENCENLIYLPSFSKLPHLKLLGIRNLDNLEYVEKASSSSSCAQKATDDTTFFPSLVSLDINNCQKLKGWFWEDADYYVSSLRTTSQLRCLSSLVIKECPNLTSFLPCPFVKDITFQKVNKTPHLVKQMMDKEEQGEVTVGTCTSSSSSSSCLATLSIDADGEMASLSEFETVFEMCSSSLQKLEILFCNSLTRFLSGLQHLTALETLLLVKNYQLNFSEDDSENMTLQWKPLHQSLCNLRFVRLSNMTSLPKGMQYLTSLTTLILEDCYKLEGLPEWMSCLSSLQSLSIDCCPAVESVTERIQNLTSLKTLEICVKEGYKLYQKFNEKLDGEDWTRLQHIPNRRYYILR